MDNQQDKQQREDWDRPERWRENIPSPPRISSERRAELAREWLEFLGCEVTEERVDELARVVMRYHPLSPKGQVANELVLKGVTPYRARVEAEYPHWRKKRFQQSAKQGRQFLKSTENVAAVCRFITEHRERTGAGPLWREVAEEFDLTQDAVRIVIEKLSDRGVVSFTTDTRSLDTVAEKEPTARHG